MELSHRDHRSIDGVHVTGDNALKRGDHMGGDEYGIHGTVRVCRVPALSPDGDHEPVDRGHRGTGDHPHLTHWNPLPDVIPQNRIHLG